MSERLTRILNLSKKTGDTVIVHDPSADHDMVVMSFDDYETLVTKEESVSPSTLYDEALFEEMSERELIDKINRDIAVWRSYQDLNEQEKHAALLEDQMVEDPLPDPFEEDFTHRSDWHRVSDLMSEKRFSRMKEKVETVDTADPIRTYVPVEDEVIHTSSAPAFGDVPTETSAIAPTDDVHSPVFQDEEPLDSDDDPVFFEEPTT